MQKILFPERSGWNEVCARPAIDIAQLDKVVSEVFENVKRNGNKAIKEYTKKFDNVELDCIEASEAEIEFAQKKLPEDLKAAIQLAKRNITLFHESQITEKRVVQTSAGVECWQEARPIEKVGIYIPGGTAPLFSTILMLAIPAQIAGCREIVLCTPPDSDGNLHPAILYTAWLTGVKRIYKVGGIQAIAAMTFGTETIPSVYKIFGPGNQYVTAAKQASARLGVSIDMPAGPSELLVMADETGDASFIAADLLSQAEHGIDSQVILVTTSAELLERVEQELDSQITVLPRREIAEKAIGNSKLILLKTYQECLDLINEYAPEHFILMVKDESYFVNGVINAGSVFIGKYTPESAGDYASGTNHTLPTNGFSKAYSGVNLDAFCKKITFQKINETGIREIGPAIECMANAEGLQAHKNAVTIRLNALKS